MFIKDFPCFSLSLTHLIVNSISFLINLHRQAEKMEEVSSVKEESCQCASYFLHDFIPLSSLLVSLLVPIPPSPSASTSRMREHCKLQDAPKLHFFGTTNSHTCTHSVKLVGAKENSENLFDSYA